MKTGQFFHAAKQILRLAGCCHTSKSCMVVIWIPKSRAILHMSNKTAKNFFFKYFKRKRMDQKREVINLLNHSFSPKQF